MSQLPDGGPAFPIINTPDTMREWEGMSLRDWFATAALNSLSSVQGPKPRPEYLARYCYQAAEAMLAERERISDEARRAEYAKLQKYSEQREELREEATDIFERFQAEEVSLDEAWAEYEKRYNFRDPKGEEVRP